MTNFNIDTSYFSNMAKSISEVAKNIMPPKINYSFLTEETKKEISSIPWEQLQIN